MLELADGCYIDRSAVEMALYEQILRLDNDTYTNSQAHDVLSDMIKFKLKVTILPHGTFRRYIDKKQNEGADLAHLKPPHINPSQKQLSSLLSAHEVMPEPVKATPAVPAGSLK